MGIRDDGILLVAGEGPEPMGGFEMRTGLGLGSTEEGWSERSFGSGMGKEGG